MRAFTRSGVVALTVALCTCSIMAQSWGVSITIAPPPPNLYRTADLWRGQIINASSTTYRVYLRAVVEEVEPGTGTVVIARSAAFELPPGPFRIDASKLEPFVVDEYKREYFDVIMQSGYMPSGSYRGCTEVVQAATGDVLATYCTDVDVSRASQPFLLAPYDQQTVTETYPVFSWMGSTPAPRSSTIEYALRIVEMFGTQTPQDAVQRNPAFLEVSDLNRTVYMYPVSARRFETGDTYAWYVTAYERRDGVRTEIGTSEVWSFTIVPGDVATLQRDRLRSNLDVPCSIENWDFETGSMSCWQADGELLDITPIRGDHPQFGAVNHHREHWFTTYGIDGGDALTGEVRSEPFTIQHNTISMLVGGSVSPDATVELVVEWGSDDTLRGPRRRLHGLTGTFVVAASSGAHVQQYIGERMQPLEWNVETLLGRRAVILVRDWSRTAHVNVDAIRRYDIEKDAR